MAVDGSNCPEDSNSTDCLLRSLMHLLNEQKKAEDNETNWDPITFFFTLPVGILATIFAVTTVFQGILVAGKGRRKTNKRAIGKWHQATEWHWNWQDMSFESRAWVPILREDTWNMRSDLKDNTDNEETAQRPSHLTRLTTVPVRITRHLGKALKSCFSWLPHSWTQKLLTWKQWAQNSQPKYQANPAATWVRFFEKVGLGYLDNPTYKSHLQLVTADYLPDDLIAAPAYGQVGAIIAAAAATGAQVKMTDDKSLYPVILGRQFQFDFRQHPTLGTIGAYAQFTQRDRDGKLYADRSCSSRNMNLEDSPPPEKLAMAMKHCRGEICLEDGVILSFKGIPQTTLNLFKESHRFQLIERLGDRNHNGDHSPPSLNGIDDVDVYCPIIIFFLAATPMCAPALFPASILETKLPLTPVGLNGRYWSALCLEAFDSATPSERPIGYEQPQWSGFRKYWNTVMPLEIHDVLKLEDPIAYVSLWVSYMLRESDRILAPIPRQRTRHVGAISQQLEIVRNQDEEINYEKIAKKAMDDTIPRRMNEQGPILEAIQGDELVLQVCINFLRNPPALLKWFATSSAGNQKEIRSRTHRQLLKVQGWLEKRGSEHFKSRSILLSKITVILLKAHKAVDGDHAPERYTAPDNPRFVDYGSLPDMNRDYLRSCHSDALYSLRTLLESFGLDESTSHHINEVRKFSEHNDIGWLGTNVPQEHQESFQQVRDKIKKHRRDLLRYFSFQDLRLKNCVLNVYCLLERLAIVVARNSSPEDNCPEWERLAELESPHNDTDDVIVYRYLMLAVLFRTAPDSEKMLHSGVWDQVVPII
ncbi:hypothetical protein CSIM01_06043 [Colletotrichum simmondsii]|uniref:Uncharacterized protein n=1 Tax=Colletotrichum simmondsii TaxID=703756 RepID=A0A135SSQ4_9PEZI|nr:hypothetical protein CSIM01_06043 [Colletotrichum simmondsii]